ncbi:MAG: GNAT family N-acetyltransferase [Candidatus Woesearchaeota archaeon]
MLLVVKALTGFSEEAKFSTPKNSGHIHINLLPEVRGKGYGSKLLKKFEERAKKTM